MRAVIVSSVAVLTAGCATSSAGLGRDEVTTALTSSLPPGEIATCVAEELAATVSLRNEGEHYWVVRSNFYGAPIHRWDFLPDGRGGTTIELRTSLRLNPGTTKVKRCAGIE